MRARQMATRCLMPPDSSPGFLCSKPDRPDHLEQFMSPVTILSHRKLQDLDGKQNVLERALPRQQRGILEDDADIAPGASRQVSQPARSRPRSDFPDPAIIISKVLLPHPLGPRQRNEFTALNIERSRGNGVDRPLAAEVGLLNGTHGYEGLIQCQPSQISSTSKAISSLRAGSSNIFAERLRIFLCRRKFFGRLASPFRQTCSKIGLRRPAGSFALRQRTA